MFSDTTVAGPESTVEANVGFEHVNTKQPSATPVHTRDHRVAATTAAHPQKSAKDDQLLEDIELKLQNYAVLVSNFCERQQQAAATRQQAAATRHQAQWVQAGFGRLSISTAVQHVLQAFFLF